MINLNEDNIWNQLKEGYPLAFQVFSLWIDEYKKKIGWDTLFHNHMRHNQVKFHHLPLEMQVGILQKFSSEIENRGVEFLDKYNIDTMRTELHFFFAKLTAEVETGANIMHVKYDLTEFKKQIK